MLQTIRGVKKKKQVIIMGIVLMVAISLGLFFYFDKYQTKYSEEIFTKAELEALASFKNQTITMGFSRGTEVNFRYAISGFLKEELAIDVEFILYDTYAEAETAAINGEVDVLINMINAPKSEELKWVSSPIANNQYVITNKNKPLLEAINLQNSKIGFVEGSILYLDLQETLGADNFDTHFFPRVSEAIEALEAGKIDALITRMDTVTERLVHQENSQIEFVFQNKILTGRFGTSNDEIHEVLMIFDEMINSSRGDLLTEKLVAHEIEHIENVITDYVQETYPDVIESYETIKIGMHNANFPYSFFAEDGTPEGVYLEIMDLFKQTTGIDYEVYNSKGITNFEHLFNQLIDNNIHFLLGIAQEIKSPEVIRVGRMESQDNIISIQKNGNNTERRGLADLTFGIVTTEDFSDQVLGITDVVRFEEYQEAIEALDVQEIDVLIGRETVLAYYRDVLGMTFLSQTDHINRMSSHSILGHKDNVGINGIMSDIQRLYRIVYPGDQDKRWTNKAINIHNKYNELRQRQEMIYLTVLIVGGTIIITWVLIRELDNRKLKKANERDPLTGLYNKGTYERKVKELIEKFPNQLGVFFFIDLDDFKSVNDTYGHEVGDQMIIKFAQILKKIQLKNPNTICFRIAGDEFGIFSTGYQTINEIEHLIFQMKARVKGQILVDGNQALPIKYSAGGSVYNLHTLNYENLKRYADFAMYKAKKDKNLKGNHAVLFDTMLLYDYYKENLTDNLVDTILRERQIYAVYQPIYALNNEDIYGYEGLSRTSNGQISNIMELIELAEKANKAHELDIMMMEEIILGFKGEGQLFINMMGKSVEYITEYIKKMVHTAQKTGLPVEQITVELSERTHWDQDSLEALKKLKEKYRFLLAIDDFGVGLSNSALVLNVQPNIVKIDRYLIQKIHEDKGKYSFVKSFIELMKASEMKIACEGIEEEEELEVLKMLGSDYGQGYLLGRPQ